MNVKELREKKSADLVKLAREKQEELQKLRFSMAGGKGKSGENVRSLRRTIARIQTVIKEGV
ncbi:MAG: 50S ribosomal protein L29 [Candidatus Ryanbacteria bacterium CG10_big_fil_rev_8_21_14_0_10_43_42]|uniref:Large ribosomal subunit protein uL29 n=1 Tax=Candidatus Ryanbacteria bacterium CG10_big_fil_rev_8_21_14_0_10_43_42 TaxID=1974864 RepID=A0A2M8KY30_9BACT|nr:MAG: 50S ribosomal protein L29 [Candidatus Ryanbacteria bacterium CG10_big_fil_rev_8_21_14_0_10_43_42]